MILAILNLCVSVMLPIKFWLNRLRKRCRLKTFKNNAMGPSWISERDDFSNSEFLCHCDTSHQVLAESDLRFGRRF